MKPYDYDQNEPAFEEEDPYERGFADKLYEDCEEPNVTDDWDNTNDFELTEPPLQPRPSAAERQVQQTYTPKKKKKHRILRFFGVLALIVVLLFGGLFAGVHFLTGEPMAENDRARKDGCCTILLAGTDESGDRTDTIMLLNIDRGQKRMSLMSIPRDTKVNSTYVPHKINSAYGVNGKGEEGMDSLMDYVAECVGFRPDGYMLLELDVFIELVDLFGGVEFDVPVDMDYEDPSQDLYIHLNKGLQTLDGEEAMGVVRFRSGYADADIGRVSVQRDFMLAAIDQWVSVKNVLKLPQALSLLGRYAQTDLSVSNLLWLAESVLLCGTDDMYMTTMPFYISGDYVAVAADEGYLNLLNEYFNPYARSISWDDLYIAY
ncbi:MAG: LCP family protein [Firmicutes bacterium]|nr:LCP family protein [Bacillota bacterium]